MALALLDYLSKNVEERAAMDAKNNNNLKMDDIDLQQVQLFCLMINFLAQCDCILNCTHCDHCEQNEQLAAKQELATKSSIKKWIGTVGICVFNGALNQDSNHLKAHWKLLVAKCKCAIQHFKYF